MPRYGWLLMLVCGLIFLIGLSHTWVVLAPPYQPPLPKRADAIVALTGGPQRIATALSMLEQDRADALLVTGLNPSISLLAFERAYANDQNCHHFYVDRATNTHDNALAASQWLEDRPSEEIFLVTDHVHIARALVEFRKRLPETTIHPVIVFDMPRSLWNRLLYPLNEKAKYLWVSSRKNASPNAKVAFEKAVRLC